MTTTEAATQGSPTIESTWRVRYDEWTERKRWGRRRRHKTWTAFRVDPGAKSWVLARDLRELRAMVTEHVRFIHDDWTSNIIVWGLSAAEVHIDQEQTL